MKSEIAVKVEQLNKRIADISRKRVAAMAEAQVIERNLKSGIDAYEEKYGVSLSGNTIEEMSKLVKDEYEKVKSAVEREYALSARVVGLIENGKVAEARKLLESERSAGGSAVVEEKVEEKSEEAVSVQQKTSETLGKMVKTAVQAGSSTEEMKSTVEEMSKDAGKPTPKYEAGNTGSVESVFPGMEDDLDDFGGFDFEDAGVQETGKNEKVKEDFAPKVSKPVEKVEKQDEDDDTFSFDGGFSFDDDIDDDFGFKEILSGSNFEV